jgi:hypothetical protein
MRFRAGDFPIVMYLGSTRMYASVMLLVTFRNLFASTISDILMCDAGIAAAKYSRVGYFPSRADYDIFYAILLRVAAIAVLSSSFAPLAQKLVVDFLRAKDGRSAD